MTTPVFRYGDIKNMMNEVFIKLEDAGYPNEAAAMASLTHIIACRIEPPDLSGKWAVNYLLECMDHHNSLTKYINDGAINSDQE